MYVDMSCVACLEKKIKDFECLSQIIDGINDGFELERCDSVLTLLSYVAENKVDVVFLTADTEELNLEKLTSILWSINNDMKIVLTSDNKADAYDAMQLHLDGFLLKPITEENVVNVLLSLSAKLCTVPLQHFGEQKNIHMVTMPKFDMYVNGEPVLFKRKKGKELMAFLVNADGTIVNGEMIIEALWPGEEIGASQRNRCRVLVNCLKNFLSGLGLDYLFITSNGQYYLSKKLYSCDADELLSGNRELMMQYNNHYMDGYEWAQGRKVVIERYLRSRELGVR